MLPILFALLFCPTCQRANQTATPLTDGRVLIAGGMIRNHAVASAELYDPRTRTFSPTGSMPAPRMSHSATLLKDGRVLISGGYGDDGHTYNSALVYDPKTGTFSRADSARLARTY